MSEEVNKHEEALKRIAWETHKLKMSGEGFQQYAQEFLDEKDLWYIIEKIGKIAMEALGKV